MKKYLIAVLAVMCLAVPVFAGAVPAKSELSLSGEFVQLDDCPDGETCDDPWAVRAALLFPVSTKGYLLLGPDIAIGNDDDLNRFGAGFDWNIFGKSGGGPFIGASAFWFQKDRDEGDQHSVLARAGFKIPVGKGAAIRLAAEDVLDGVGQDSTDLIVTAGILARF